MTSHALGLPRNRDINEMTNEELQVLLREARATYMTDKGDTTRGKNPPGGRMRETRRTIARVLTAMRKCGVFPQKFETPMAL